jgi:protein-tyrosine kinase
MSRVFEALEKASKEKKEVVVTQPGNGHAWVETAIPDERGFEREEEEVDHRFNGKDRSAAVPEKSWRERAEELLFGRDLRSYKSYPIVALDKGSPAAEQYKILREQVKKLRAEMGARCLSVTSPVKGDGKSIVATNLAAAMALGNEERVLLIDCDLRDPQVHQYFGLQRSPGLTDYLTSSSNENVLNYVRETSIPGLQVLTAGRSSSLSSELLATEKMRNLMDEIRLKFHSHQIILDTPPVLSTPEPLILAGKVDGIIMVIRAGKTPRDCLSEALETLKSDKIMGIVLNGADLGITSKYYDY